MLRYILQKLVATIPVLLFVTVCVFLLIHLIPGDPAVAMLGENATPAAVTSLRHQLGLDLPLPKQYLRWLSHVLTGDLGRSIRSGQPIGDALVGAIGPTFELTGLALVVAIAVGAPAGILAALRPNSVPDIIISFCALIGTSMPTFWSGLIFISLFAVRLGWLPPSGYVAAAHSPLLSLKFMALPALTLGLTVAAVVMRQTRASLMDIMRNDYVRTARSKGLAERTVIRRHALRNALIPVVTVVGLTSGVLLGGAVVTETIFAIPGMGQLIVTAIFQRDFPMVQAAVLVIAITVITMNLLVDVLYVYLDPEIRY